MKVSKDILKHLIDNYFDDLTVYKCQYVSKTVYNLINYEKLRKVRVSMLKQVLKENMNDLYRKNMIFRLQGNTPPTLNKKETKKWINKMMENPIILCKNCEKLYLSVEFDKYGLHKGCISVLSTFCKLCELHHYWNLEKCPLKKVTCSELIKHNQISICPFEGPLKEVQHHQKSCLVTCRQCDTLFSLDKFYDHFFYVADGIYTRSVCRKFK